MKQRNKSSLVNMEKNERAISAAGGAVMLIGGLSRLPLTAVALLAGGGYLLYRGVTGHCWGYELLGINRAMVFTENEDAPVETAVSTQPSTIAEDDRVEEASWESFPASDAPAWTRRRREGS